MRAVCTEGPPFNFFNFCCVILTLKSVWGGGCVQVCELYVVAIEPLLRFAIKV